MIGHKFFLENNNLNILILENNRLIYVLEYVLSIFINS